MRVRVLGAMGVVCAVSVAAMLGANSARAEPDVSFEPLTTVIKGSDSLPAVQQAVFLQRVALAETRVTSGLAFPPSPCAATGLIDSIGFTTLGLYAAGQVDQTDFSSLIGAVTRENSAIFSAYPPSPCNVAFGGGLGDG